MAAGQGLIGKYGIPRQVVPVTPANDGTGVINGVGLRVTGAGIIVFKDGSDTARAVTMAAHSELAVQVKEVLASAEIDGSTVTGTATGVHVFVLGV